VAGTDRHCDRCALVGLLETIISVADLNVGNIVYFVAA
jgi:hypothetical protein